MAQSKNQAVPQVTHSVVKTEHGDEIPISVIPIARSGRPDFKFTTTYPIMSELLCNIVAHAAKVEAGFTASLLRPKQLRPYYER